MPSSRNGGRPKPNRKRSNGRRVVLTGEELRALRVACERYRHSLPVYLASTQSDLRLIKAVIRKLS